MKLECLSPFSCICFIHGSTCRRSAQHATGHAETGEGGLTPLETGSEWALPSPVMLGTLAGCLPSAPLPSNTRDHAAA